MEKKNGCFKIDKDHNQGTLLAHCIIHREILYNIVQLYFTVFKNVLESITKCINDIRANT